MSDVQVIEKDGKPAFYVLPAALWDKVRDAVEDAEDAAAYAQAVAEDDGVRIPLAVVQATLDGVHVVRAWREYRGLSQQALAAAAGVSKPFISQIESGARAGTVATLKKLAAALGVPLGALVP
jgi:antitoxin component HigA of HigAB toxin-antitoxin module